MYRVRSIATLVLAIMIVSASSLSAQMKEWTIAVYVNADNNLDPFGVEDHRQMAQVGSNAHMNVVTLFDRFNAPATLNYVEKNSLKVIKNMGEVDMGDYKTLVNFVQTVKTEFPSKKLAVVIWNHGSGWRNIDAEDTICRGISYDDTNKNYITTAQLGLAMKQIEGTIGKKLDVMIFDACLMQMVEVAYVCHKHVKFIVGSEDNEPGSGAPYDSILRRIKAATTPSDLAKTWAKEFAKSFSNGSQGTHAATQSAIDCSKFPKLLDSINGLSKAVMSGSYKQEVIAAQRMVQRFYAQGHIDLLHFVTLLGQNVQDASLKAACKNVLAAGKSTVIANGYSSDAHTNARGIAIYLPDDFVTALGYRDLAFAKEMMWFPMIRDLFKKNSADRIEMAMTDGNLSELQDFMSAASLHIPQDHNSVLQQIKFKLLTERAFPNEMTECCMQIMGSAAKDVDHNSENL